MTAKLSFWSAWLGNLFEHYNTALFGFLSPFLAPLLFPDEDPLWALMLTYLILPLSMLARPLGAVLFGVVGARYGKRTALSLSLIGMGVVSMGMGLCPLSTGIALLSPIWIYLGRSLQNIFASGEVAGGALFMLELAPQKRGDVVSGFYGASTLAGILCASGGIAWACHGGHLEKTWRLLYLWGGVTALLGYVLWRPLHKVGGEAGESFSLRETWHVLKEEKKALGAIALVYGFSYATYLLSFVLMNGFIPLVTAFTREQMIALNTPLLFLDFCLLPLFGWIASFYSRHKLMGMSALATLLLGAPLFHLLEGGSWITIIVVRVCFVLLGVAFCAPFYMWAQELVSSSRRYLIVSLGSALGSQLIGSPTATLSLWLFHKTGHPWSVSLYWVFLAGASLIPLLFLKRQGLYLRTNLALREE